MRILLAEDNAVLADRLTRSLRQSGYATDCVKNGLEADSMLATQDFNLLILDLGLPKLSGLEVLQRLRTRNSHLPVLILTATDSIEQRVRALTRRDASSGPTVIRHGSLTYDQAGRIAYINDQMLDLSARELGLLEVLLRRSGRLVSKEQLVNHVCKGSKEVGNNAIEVYVHRLRKKIEVGDLRIATVRGLGYCLEKFTEPVPLA